ncbi:MAG: hypothetical protein IJ106_03200 [Parasporobacterium sp.]|nr:hypothetical protein [Parasporobacterium sp.]
MSHKRPATIKYRFLAAAAAVVLAVSALLLTACGARPDSPQSAEGVNYIREMEQVDVTSVEKEVNAVRQELFLADVDEKIAEDPDYVWTALDQINTVMMGDSRVVPYATYGFMDESRVLAEGGQSVREIVNHYDELRAVNPSLVVLGYGLNDIGWGFYSPEEYADAMMGYVDDIQAMLPDAYIYIQSIIIPRIQVEEYYDFPGLVETAIEWNAEEQRIYQENGYRTIDISDLVEEYSYLFGEDGAHFYADFYPHLAERILKTYLSDTMEFDD